MTMTTMYVQSTEEDDDESAEEEATNLSMEMLEA